MNLVFLIHPQIEMGSVSLNGGAKFMMEDTSKSSAVTITMKGSRLVAPPLTLPELAPALTDTAADWLRSYGAREFTRIYGTHFIVGWRLGGHLTFSFQFNSNEQVGFSNYVWYFMYNYINMYVSIKMCICVLCTQYINTNIHTHLCGYLCTPP